MTDFYVNACGASVSPSVLALVLERSGLIWEMHPAQVYALKMMLLNNQEKNVVSNVVVADVKELGPKTAYTLIGIPIHAKEEYPMSLIRLMCNGEELTRIEALGIPTGFVDNTEFDKFWVTERDKFAKIGYRNGATSTFCNGYLKT